MGVPSSCSSRIKRISDDIEVGFSLGVDPGLPKVGDIRARIGVPLCRDVDLIEGRLFPGRGERMNSVIKYGGAAGGPEGDGGVAWAGTAVNAAMISSAGPIRSRAGRNGER
jgi:hypothetical protein